MPQTTVLFYQEKPGDVPVLDWLAELKKTQPKAFARCVERIEQLAQRGHELRRPYADSIGNGLYELRAHLGRVQYRILYAFHGPNRAPLLHAFTKEKRIPPGEIERALERKRKFEDDPDEHTYKP